MNDAADPGTISVQSRRLGRLVSVEDRLVAALGEVLAACDDDQLVVRIADRIRSHLGAAAIVRARLPVLREFPVEELLDAGPLPAWDALLDSLRRSTGAEALASCASTVEPALGAAYGRVVADASPAGAPSVRRHLAPLAGVGLGDVGSPGGAVVADPELVSELLR